MKNYEQNVKMKCACNAILKEDTETGEILCSSCNRKYKDIEEVKSLPINKRAIEKAIEEIGDNVASDYKKDLKKIFKNNPFFNVK